MHKTGAKKPTTVAQAKPQAKPQATQADAKPAASTSKTVVATTAAERKNKKSGQADNDVDLIEALIVHTMQGGAPADAKGGK